MTPPMPTSADSPSPAAPTLLIVGLGLLGGSIALAARQRGLVSRIVAVGRRDLSPAVQAGLIDEATKDLAAAAANADIIILCTPVETICQQLPIVRAVAPAHALITDVGSTKRRIVSEAARIFAGEGVNFVGSHPMVGGHQTGWESARGDLFEGGVVYVTPSDESTVEAAARTGWFWRSLGAPLVYIHPDRHDYLCGMLSHLPHLTAVALTRRLQESREDVNLLRVLSGNGLRDTTRIAMGSAEVWREIFQHNSDVVAVQARELAAALVALAEDLEAGEMDDLQKILAEVAAYRQRFQPPSA